MKTKIYLGLITLSLNVMAQQNPTGTAPPPSVNPPNLPNTINQTERAWYRGGNFLGGTAGSANIFGTKWNSPIYTQTDGVNRMKLNGSISYPVIGAPPGNTNRNGFLLLTNNPNVWTGGAGLMSATYGAHTLLHLVGDDGTLLQTGGFRNWMRNGITISNNFDVGFIGVRKMPNLNGGVDDVSDMVIGWSDNPGTGYSAAPDNLVFNFISNNGLGNDDLGGNSLYGRETMRHTSWGNIGIGPRFDNTWQPTSTFHQHQENAVSSWMQITNQYMTQAGAAQTAPTQINATNGFKFGILGDATKLKNGNAFIYNQEERHLIFSTNHTNPTDAQFTNERMRITNISAPTNLTNNANSACGVWNPGSIANQDLTRVSISHNPATPVTRPLALLHLGYNTGSILNPTTTDGWRSWMDVGTFVSRGSDNMYIGLKPEGNAASFGDRKHAVIIFGDNYSNTNVFNIAPDKLRIIFTSPAVGQPSPGPGAMSSQDGLEFVRYVPFHNTALAINDPRTGFGDFQNLTPVGTINPGNTIEINSILAGYNLQHDSVTGSYVGGTGASGLRFRDLTSLSLAIPDSIADSLKIDRKKVLTVDSLGNVVLINNSGGNGVGNYCGATPANPLLADYEIPMNNHNYYFSGQGEAVTNIAMGLPCGTPLYFAKLQVYQTIPNDTWNNGISIAGQFDNVAPGVVAYGVTAGATGICQTNIGLAGNAVNGVNNIGVFGQAPVGPNNYAGYFDGDVYTLGGGTSVMGYISSDKNIKTNINTLNKNLEVISKLRPVNYKFDNAYAPQLKLNNHVNYGFIAQEVETIVPELVNTSTVIATYDSIGNVINPAKVVKALNYDGLIPFAIGGIQELNAKQKEMQASLDKAGLSDAQVKTNVNSFNALAKIKTLQPVQYNFTNANVPQLTFKPNLDYGFVAQQLETVYPELVDTLKIDATYDSLGVVVNPSQVLKTVNYKAMSGLLVRSIQEQQSTIDSLRSMQNTILQQLASLASQINSCCSNTNTTRQSNINQLDIDLSDKDAIVLEQNIPNPFAEKTSITYNVPASVGKAQLIFFNNLGQVIQTVDIKTRGKGNVNVFASDLSSGLYNYSLVADGKVIDSKKMVRE